MIYAITPKRSSVIDQIEERDWNGEFNKVLNSELLERAEKLRKLEKEFVEVASLIGKEIINEKNLHISQKTIKPLTNINGIAGGEKYQVKGIFFKFSQNSNNLYGNDENAMKVACHELKGHTALVSCGMVHGLKLGLMTVIDYLGSRLTAISILPISDKTLIYGSSDGGKLVFSSLPIMNNIMKQCGKILNLKGHLAGIGKEKKFIYGPCDLEGHLGKDGNLYCIDLARLFPPETPNKKFVGGFLYHLLRPELVKKYDKPLSSDAFTLFGEHDADKHNTDVRNASEFLHSKIIPDFANFISNYCEYSSSPDNNEDISIDKILIKLHRAGINIRYLGKVRSKVTNIHLRKLLLTEICARVFKNEIRKKLRESTSSNFDLYSKQFVIHFFNLIFEFSSPNSQKFWNAIKKSIQFRYCDSLSHYELDFNFDIRKHVLLERLFYRLQDLIGVSFNASYDRDFPLSLKHFNFFYAKTKQMYAIPRIEADTAVELAKNTKDIDESKRLLTLAYENYVTVLNLKPDDHIVLSSKFFHVFFIDFY